MQAQTLPKTTVILLVYGAGLAGGLWSSYAMLYSSIRLPFVVASVMVLNGALFLAFSGRGTGPKQIGARLIGSVKNLFSGAGARKPSPTALPPELKPERSQASGQQTGETASLPVYTREEVEQRITQVRTSLAYSVFSDPDAVSKLKEQLHYLHCYRLAYTSSSGQDSSKIIKQLAISQYLKQRELLGGGTGDKGV